MGSASKTAGRLQVRSTRGPLGWGQGPYQLAEGPRLGSLRPRSGKQKLTAAPPPSFTFSLFPSSLPTEFSLKRVRGAGVSDPAPARFGACPAGLAP